MEQAARVIPDYVPPELVVEADIYKLPVGEGGAQCAWAQLKGPGPISWSPYNGGHWIANTSDAVFRFYRDFENFSAKELSIPPVNAPDPFVPNQSDPPQHADYRKNIMPLFTSDAVEAKSDEIRALCVELIEEMKPKGECEFFMDFALKFPLGIFLNMMGLPPEDRMYLRRLAEIFSDSPVLEEKVAAAKELADYVDKHLDDRIANPRDDVMTMVTGFKIDGRPYTRSEMRGTVQLLMAAGLDTVAGMVSFVALHFAQHPEHADYVRSKLGDEKEMHQIVQEFLRRYPIVSSSRRLLKDYTYQGVTMKKGDMIVMPSAFFNLENRECPEKVDFERANKRHITFGSGTHACAGALLAREEIKIFLEEWLTRMPEVRLRQGSAPRVEALVLNGVKEMHLAWDPVVEPVA